MTRDMMVARAVKLFLFASLCWVLHSTEAWAQLTTTGTLSGTVTDSRGAVVSQASITVISNFAVNSSTSLITQTSVVYQHPLEPETTVR